MPKKTSRTAKPGELGELPAYELPEVKGDVVEFDPADPDQGETAKVQEAGEDDPSVTHVDDGLIKAQEAIEEALMAAAPASASGVELHEEPAGERDNIVGCGVGEKVVNGKHTGVLAVKVFVAEKLSAGEISDDAFVPETINGFPTDVEEVGDVSALRFTGRYRPAPGGSSIGHVRITAGTLGCLVIRNNGHFCILSNNHVLANSNAARLGDPIVQPGPADGGRDPRDRIGRLEAFVPIQFGGAAPNDVDAAVALTNRTLVVPRMHCYRISPVPIAARLGMTVRKCGRTTQGTLGVITAVNVTIRVNYGTAGVALFRNQLQIRGVGPLFSQGGDSGSLVVSAGTRQPAGLLFAGGGVFTFANPIALVIRALGIRQFLS